MTRRLRTLLIAIAATALLTGLAVAYLAHLLGDEDRAHDAPITAPSTWDDVGWRHHGDRP